MTIMRVRAPLPFLEICWRDVGNSVNLSQAAAHVTVFRRPEQPQQLLGHVDSALQHTERHLH